MPSLDKGSESFRAAARLPSARRREGLNHSTGTISGVAAVYNQHGYLEEKRQALERPTEKVLVISVGCGSFVVVSYDEDTTWFGRISRASSVFPFRHDTTAQCAPILTFVSKSSRISSALSKSRRLTERSRRSPNSRCVVPFNVSPTFEAPFVARKLFFRISGRRSESCAITSLISFNFCRAKTDSATDLHLFQNIGRYKQREGRPSGRQGFL